jgi:hypothetical protein
VKGFGLTLLAAEYPSIQLQQGLYPDPYVMMLGDELPAALPPGALLGVGEDVSGGVCHRCRRRVAQVNQVRVMKRC